jgi:HNH endonuclease
MLVSPVEAHNQGRPRRRRSELERLLDAPSSNRSTPSSAPAGDSPGTTTPYGRIAKAQDSYTHRLGWKLLRGDIPGDKELHHRCGVYACWNPDHLELVTHAENLAHRRKTHCKRGQLLSNENVRINPRTGARSCRSCVRENQRRFRAAASHARSSDPSSEPLGNPGRPRGELLSVGAPA